MKTFLLIENNADGFEGYDGRVVCVAAPDFATALDQRYREELEEEVINVSKRDWPPTEGSLFRLDLKAYEVTRYIRDANEQVKKWEAEALVDLIKEEEEYRAAEPARKKQAKLDALKKQAAALGLKVVDEG